MEKVVDYYNQEANRYGDLYSKYYIGYPANKIRLKLVLKLLKKQNPATLLDIGCGTCEPLIAFLKQGINAIGIDNSEEMIKIGKENLIRRHHSPKRIELADIENISPEDYIKEEAITAFGVMPHIKNKLNVIKKIATMLSDNGVAYIEFRNKLFSLYTLNEYSPDLYLHDLIGINKYSEKIVDELTDDFCGILMDRTNYDFKEKEISYKDIQADFSNPLTIEDKLFSKAGLGINDIHFYHYHAMPPHFERDFPKEFREESLKLEKPQSWKGLFMASAFIVEARKL